MTRTKPFPEDSVWKNKAFTFLVRARRELWGKHNEDILAWMFQQGLKNRFAQDMLLGWNKYPKIRPADNWGLPEDLNNPLIHDGKLTLPPGLVIPYIVDKDLRKLIFYDYQSDQPGRSVPLPGGSTEPMILGGPSQGIAVVFNIIHGLYVHQEIGDTWTVLIPHDPHTPDNKTLTMIHQAETALLFPDPLSDVSQPWLDRIAPALCCHPYTKPDDIIQMIWARAV